MLIPPLVPLSPKFSLPLTGFVKNSRKYIDPPPLNYISNTEPSWSTKTILIRHYQTKESNKLLYCMPKKSKYETKVPIITFECILIKKLVFELQRSKFSKGRFECVEVDMIVKLRLEVFEKTHIIFFSSSPEIYSAHITE